MVDWKEKRGWCLVEEWWRWALWRRWEGKKKRRFWLVEVGLVCVFTVNEKGKRDLRSRLSHTKGCLCYLGKIHWWCESIDIFVHFSDCTSENLLKSTKSELQTDFRLEETKSKACNFFVCFSKIRSQNRTLLMKGRILVDFKSQGWKEEKIKALMRAKSLFSRGAPPLSLCLALSVSVCLSLPCNLVTF